LSVQEVTRSIYERYVPIRIGLRHESVRIEFFFLIILIVMNIYAAILWYMRYNSIYRYLTTYQLPRNLVRVIDIRDIRVHIKIPGIIIICFLFPLQQPRDQPLPLPTTLTTALRPPPQPYIPSARVFLEVFAAAGSYLPE